MSARQMSRDASMADAARNERRSARASAGLGVLLAVATALLGAWALVKFATPCQGGTLC